jgi:hypothetical protein
MRFFIALNRSAIRLHPRRARRRKIAARHVLEPLESRALLATDPTIAGLVAEVQVSSYRAHFVSMPVNQGAQRGYNADKSPQADLLSTRSIVVSALTNALPSGSSVTQQTFDSSGYVGVNIVGVLPGQGPHRNEQILIGAHYDSVQNPGADDNASGVAGLLEAARVMGDGDDPFDRTIVFVAFDQEESRGNGARQGSQVYASAARAAGTSIVATYMLDMIAYNHKGNNVATIGYPSLLPRGSSATLASEVASIFKSYTNLNVRTQTTLDRTDAYSFYQKGYPSITLVEQLSWFNPTNPYYHKTSDFYLRTDGTEQTVNGRPYLDFNYATEMTQGIVAAAATKARIHVATAASSRGGSPVGSYRPWMLLVQASLDVTPAVAPRVSRPARPVTSPFLS